LLSFTIPWLGLGVLELLLELGWMTGAVGLPRLLGVLRNLEGESVWV